MEVEVEDLCDQLNLIDLEKEEICVEFSSMVVAKGSHCLLSKLLTTRLFK